jgi:hypothetical protein
VREAVRKSFDGVAIADPGPGSKSPAYADYSHWVTLNERTGKKLVLCNIAHAHRFLSFRDLTRYNLVLRPHCGTEIDSPSSTASPRHHSGRSLAAFMPPVDPGRLPAALIQRTDQ